MTISQIEMEQDISQTEVLIALGDQLIKESMMLQYIQEADDDSVSIFQRAVDFFSRILNQFISWLRRGTLKEAKKKLEKMKDHHAFSNKHTPEGQEHLNTVFWDLDWFKANVTDPLHRFHQTPLIRMITEGQIKANYDRDNTAVDTKTAEDSFSALRKVYENMKSSDNKPKPMMMQHGKGDAKIEGKLDWIIHNFIDFAINDVYDNLKKCKEAIKVIKDTELKEKKYDDSKNVSQRWGHLLTLLAKCFAEEMRICQLVANVVVNGAIKQASPITSENDAKVKVYKNLTLDQFKTNCKEIFSQHPDVASSGIVPTMHDKTNKDSKCHIELHYTTGGKNLLNYISCTDINPTIKKFINTYNASNPIMPEDVS